MSEEENTGIGCIGVILVIALVGWIIQHIVAILVAVLLLLVVGALAIGIGAAVLAAVDRAAARSRCPVCQNWAQSVLLTELAAEATLCGDHAERLARIGALEREVLDEE